MKKCIFCFLLSIIVGAAVIAQSWYDSYAPAVEDNTLFINAGVGIGPIGSGGIGIPPLSVSVDYKLPIDLPITVGSIVTFSTWKRSIRYYIIIDVDITYMNFGFGARVTYHFNFLEYLDTYAGITLGYVYQNGKAKVTYYGEITGGESFFLWGINIGARYFFTDFIGAYMELGYSGLQYVGVGLSVKF